MTQSEYVEYLYETFLKAATEDDQQVVESVTRLRNSGNLSIAFMKSTLEKRGIEHEVQHITDVRTLQRAIAHCVHSVATIMFRYQISFDEALSPQYHEERWDMLAHNGAPEDHKAQLLGMTKAQLVDGVI